MDDYLLRVSNLNLSVPAKGKRFLAVSDLSFALKAGGSLGIVGESGSGKTLTALAIAGLNNPQVRLESGSILFNRQELTSLPETDLRSLRGSELAVIFQDSGGALNPSMRVGDQVSEGLLLGEGMALTAARQRTASLFAEVELPGSALLKYPHQLSGGQRQRVMIAIALAREPSLLIADEPTTALDLTTQQQLLQLLWRLCRQYHMALLLISHDIAVVRSLCQEILVLYAGQVMERGDTESILEHPTHPYTKGLLGAMPAYSKRNTTLETLQGIAEPIYERLDEGCVFASRCPIMQPLCREQRPPLQQRPGGNLHCFLPAIDAHDLRLP